MNLKIVSQKLGIILYDEQTMMLLNLYHHLHQENSKQTR